MFITLEGPDGSGKSTQAPLLRDFLCAQGFDVLATREPGGTPVGDQIRKVLFDLKNSEMEPRAELLLFQASRAQLVSQVIRPHLAAGGIVLSDRYADSTIAYQGYGHRLDLAQVRAVVDFATGGLKPDLTLLLDLEAEEGLRRRGKSGDWNRMDAYTLEFHRRVRQGYLEMAYQEPGRWMIVDAQAPVDQLQASIRKIVLTRLARTGGEET
jgi:dTMP kinase